MNISTKLYVSLGVIAVQIIACLALLKIETQQQSDHVNSLVESNIEAMVDIASMKGEVYSARVNLRDALLATQENKPESDILQYRKTYTEMAGMVEGRFKELNSTIKDPEMRRELEKAMGGWNDLKQVVGKIEAATISRDFPASVNFLLTECFVAAGTTISGISELLKLKKEDFSAKILKEEESIAKMVWTTIALMLALTAVTVFVVYRVITNIKTGLNKAVDLSNRIGEGNLTGSIEVSGNDEIGQLMKSFQSMSTNLRTLVTSIQHSGASLTANSGTLQTAAEEMNKAAIEQADATSSMAAAVEELSVSIGQITENSTEASAMATEAQNSADEGIKSLDNVVQSIRSISGAVDGSAESVKEVAKQSEGITEIVSTITEIADRTNLLALNAAIEAARAGESGRGFAVVADEVRKLAEQTKGATDKISRMVGHIQLTTKEASLRMDESVNRVQDGIAQADAVSGTINDIRRNAQFVNQAIQAISVSMKEQSNVSLEIGRNVERVAQMTEENTAAIAQNRDVSGQIGDASLVLSKSVGVFKI